ncbi:MAG TPA: flagellar biosynthetic protein FliO [Verrucomicrobiae bacterium]|jgi:flagellar biogenesis protein FliO|nr:flagellar biosynthetic protein FliO [Verrucomicrobiae bacterium]
MFGSELATPALIAVGAAVVALFSRRLGSFFQPKATRRDFPRHLGSLMLNPKCSVALVQAGPQTLLLGVTASSVTLLAKLPAIDDTAPELSDDEEGRLQ